MLLTSEDNNKFPRAYVPREVRIWGVEKLRLRGWGFGWWRWNGMCIQWWNSIRTSWRTWSTTEGPVCSGQPIRGTIARAWWQTPLDKTEGDQQGTTFVADENHQTCSINWHKDTPCFKSKVEVVGTIILRLCRYLALCHQCTQTGEW